MATSPVLPASKISPTGKRPPAAVKERPVDERDALMASIRGAGKALLKPATERELAPVHLDESSPPDIASALRTALMARQAATMGTAVDDDSSDQLEEDDDDW
jgi:hypothetical protein